MKQKLTWILTLICALLLVISAYYLNAAKQYDFKTLQGESYEHADFENGVLIVNYFAEWCAPCLREIPELNAFHQQAPKNVHLFAVSYDNLSTEKLNSLVQKYTIQFPIIQELKIPFKFDKPQYLPATFIVGKDGKVVKQLLGEQTVTTLNKAIAGLNKI